MNTSDAREAARHSDGRFGAQRHTPPEAALEPSADISTWGTWDEEGFHSIDIETVGLRHLTPPEQASASTIVMTWFDGDRHLDAPANVPVSAVTTSLQPVLRRDALLWYTQERRERDDTFDDEISFYGADGPLGILNSDGTVTVVDGNHRFAAAKLRGDDTFPMQLLRARPA